MDVGFYNSTIGYWVGIGFPDQAAVDAYLLTCEEGTMIIPIMPNTPGFTYVWDTGLEEWVAHPERLTLADFSAEFHRRLDAIARAKNYQGTADLLSYATSTSSRHKANYQAFVAWRDQASDSLFEIEDGYAADPDGYQPPTMAAFIAGLPPTPWVVPESLMSRPAEEETLS